MVPECFQVCFLCCRDKIQKGDEVDWDYSLEHFRKWGENDRNGFICIVLIFFWLGYYGVLSSESTVIKGQPKHIEWVAKGWPVDYFLARRTRDTELKNPRPPSGAKPREVMSLTGRER
jgi:hypothetical protein